MTENQEMKIGCCVYCGQANCEEIYDGCVTDDERNKVATRCCGCPDAERERRISEQIENAQDRIQQLFGQGAENLDFEPFNDGELIELMNNTVSLIAKGIIKAASVQITGECRAKISLTAKDKIKVERTETMKYQLEE